MAENLADTAAESKSFRQLLTDTNYCINLFEELEYKRNWTQWASDWAVGERDSINVVIVLENLRKLKDTIESVLAAYDGLIVTLDKVKVLKLRNEEYNRFLPGATDNSKLTELTENLNTHVTSQKEIIQNITSQLFRTKQIPVEGHGFNTENLIITVSSIGIIGALGAAAFTKKAKIIPLMPTTVSKGAITMLLTAPALQIALVAGIVSGIAFIYLHLKGKARGLRYQKVNELSEVLLNHKVYSEFQTHQGEIESISKRLNSLVHGYQKKFNKLYKEQTNRTLQERSNLNREKVLIEAMKLYKDTLNSQLKELVTEEPDMNEETRRKTAKRVAKNSCKSFLKGKLDYTNVEADEFVELLQN